MWVPRHFEEQQTQWSAEVIDQNPFASLVTVSDGAPIATHVPVLIHPEDREQARSGLEGVRILGHLARENTQWQISDPSAQALLIVGGPHAYVSPVAYSDLPAAPTWNYVAVHLTGDVRWIHDREEMMKIIDLTIDRTEANSGTGWDREPSRDYFEQILSGVVAFELRVETSTSTFKLNQDAPPHRRREVIDAANSGSGSAHPAGPELQEWTKRANPDVFPPENTP